MNELLRGLNPAQRDAVTSPASVLQVLAPPGSGKTKTLTARVSYLITERHVKPWNMIVCTFTVKAAREMKERIKELVNDGLEKKLILGTFHSVARRYLVQYGDRIGIDKRFGIADTTDTKAIITRIVRKERLGIEPGAAIGRISSQKAKGISCEQYARTAKNIEHEFAILYTAYEDALKASNLLDYDDLLLRCAELLRSHPECVSNIHAVLIDEFQDTNNVQFELMCLFAQYRKAVTIVGDPDQSIYGWRNAEIKNLDRMQEYYADTHVIHLEENYRSAGAILESAQRVIEQDTNRPPKKLKATFRPGDQPVLRNLPTADAEARWLVAEIQRTQALSANLLVYNDFAILLRSAAASRQIESVLGKAGIPYRMVGGTKFFDRVEIKLLLDYLRAINSADHNDALLRIINTPARALGDVTTRALLAEAERKKISLGRFVVDLAQGNCRSDNKLSAKAQKGLSELANILLTGRKMLAGEGCPQASPFDLVEWLLKKLDLKKFLEKKYPDEEGTRWAGVEEFKIQTAELTAAIVEGDDAVEAEILPEIEGVERRAIATNEDALTLFLNNIALSSEVQKKNEEDGDAAQQNVTISTIHAAKGLEWPVVFIPACYDGHIPHSRAEDTDEERRLLYVGMTRAQALLYMSCPAKNSKSSETTMSPFLSESGLDAYFADFGPLLPNNRVIQELARTLRRECPPEESLDTARNELIRLGTALDNYWPLDGTFPEEEKGRWEFGKEKYFSGAGLMPVKRQRPDGPIMPIPAPAGFVPASLVSMNQANYSTASATLPLPRRVPPAQPFLDREVETAAGHKRSRPASPPPALPRKSSKAAAGSANITSFFSRTPSAGSTPAPAPDLATRPTRINPTPRYYEHPQTLPTAVASLPHQAPNPLTDISNHAHAPRHDVLRPAYTKQVPASLQGRVRTAPHAPPRSRARYTAAAAQDPTAQAPPRDPYAGLLSSSPQKAEDDEERLMPEPVVRPASTFHTHTTSMAQVQGGVRTGAGQGPRRLGMGGPFRPWSARGGRGG